MRTNTLAAVVYAFGLSLALFDCSPPQDRGGAQAPSGGVPAPAAQAPASAPPAPAEPTSVSVTIRVTCAESVNVFYGKDPKFGSGTASRLVGNSTQSSLMGPGDMIWLLDQKNDPVGSTTVSASTHEVTLTCNAISAH